MTELIYLEDSYLSEFEATVVGHDGEQLGALLDRTAFYPGGGGQQPDQGELWVGDTKYIVSRVGRGNLHIIDGDMPPVGSRGTWNHRLGAALQDHADAYGNAYSVWRHLARLPGKRHRRQYGYPFRADGF